jgi:Domain of unknown function (DUF932)
MLSAHKIDHSVVEIDSNDPRAAAVLSLVNGPKVSNRYAHVTTKDLVDYAVDAGWAPFNYGTKRRNSRSLTKGVTNETAAHFVAMRPSDQSFATLGLEKELVLDQGIHRRSRAYPVLMLSNSHEGTKAVHADLGLWEFICSNTSIWSSESYGSMSWRHTGVAVQRIRDDLLKLLNYAPWLMRVRKFLTEVNVTHDNAISLAERIIPLRWDGEKYSVNPEAIVAPHFQEQSALSAYNVFQTVQRSLVSANNFTVHRLTPGKQKNPNRRVRGITNFTEQRRLNKGLWTHTQQWLNELGHEIPQFEEDDQ